MTISAFTFSTPLVFSPSPAKLSPVCPPFTLKASLPRIVPDKSLKHRSLVTLRGLSDLSSAAVLHEISVRLLLGASLNTSGAADSQLLLGGLMGVWTAAVFADRVREANATFIAESRDLPARWDSAIIHRPALDEDDAVAAVAWLAALDEMEGVEAGGLLKSLAAGEDEAVRIGVAFALGEFGSRSNIAVGVLSQLAEDGDQDVRDAAEKGLERYRGERETPSEEGDMARVLDSLFDDRLVEERGGLVETDVRDCVLDAVAQRVEFLSSIALSEPRLSRFAPDEEVMGVDNVVKVDVPLLEGLRRAEVHGLCTLAFVPAAYELMSVGWGQNLPLRFIGLGWLLTFGGLVAYPQSASLWRKFSKAMDDFVVLGRKAK